MFYPARRSGSLDWGEESSLNPMPAQEIQKDRNWKIDDVFYRHRFCVLIFSSLSFSLLSLQPHKRAASKSSSDGGISHSNLSNL